MLAHIALLFVALAFGNEVDDLMYQGQVDRAVLAARDLVMSGDNIADDEVYIDLLLSSGVAQTAETYYRAQLAKDPKQADNHYLLGRALVSAEAAAASYQAALKIDPNHARSHMGMGAIHRSNGALEASQSAYRRALKGDDSLGEAWSGLSAALVMSGDYAGALAVAREALVATPNESSPYLSIALLSPKEAVTILTAGAKAVPNDPMIYETLTEAYLANNKGAAAKSTIAKALSIDGRRPAALTLALYADAMSRGLLDATGYAALVAARQQVAKDPSKALAALNKLVTAYPQCGLVYVARASAHTALGDGTASMTDLGRALEHDENNFDAHAALGMQFLNAGHPHKALPHLMNANEFLVGDVGLGVGLATAQIALGNVDSARTALERLYGSHGKDVRVVLAYARVLAHDEEFESAYKLLKISLAGTMDGRVAIALAGAAQDVGRFDEAADLIQQLAEQTNDPRLFRLAATIRAKAQK